MQPLDVGIFQLYIHWHDVEIQDAFLEFNMEYTVSQFLRNFIRIWDNTFKKGTIQ